MTYPTMSEDVWLANKETARRHLDPADFEQVEHAYRLMRECETSRMGDTARPHDETLALALEAISDAMRILATAKGDNDERLAYLNWSLSGGLRLYVPERLWRLARWIGRKP